MHRTILRFAADEVGASAVEYCLVASIIGIYVVGGLGYMGINLFAMASEIADAMLGSGG
jgi:Flp pilus assembly pilin Flp